MAGEGVQNTFKTQKRRFSDWLSVSEEGGGGKHWGGLVKKVVWFCYGTLFKDKKQVNKRKDLSALYI